MSDKDTAPKTMLTSLKASHMAKKSTDEIAEILQVNLQRGLQSSDAMQRKLIYGPNDFEHDKEDPLWYRYICQFKEPMILLLLFSAVVSLIMRQFDNAISITVAIIIVVTVAFIQEYRSEKALEALKQLMPPKTHCIRDAQLHTLVASELVPGDVIVLGVGDRIPADLRLFETTDLFVDESSFTGETEPVEKFSETISDYNSHDSSHSLINIVFMGTLVRSGSGKGVVVGTGKNSEFGEIFKMMQSEEPPKTPLQKSMDILGKQLTMYSFGIISLIVMIGLIQGRQIMTLFTIGVSLAVAAIPEGLPIVVTVTLAIGQFRMAKRNAIVKKLPAVETLGCVNVICSDKTGTLTKNEMTITNIISSSGDKAVVTGVGYASDGDIKIDTSDGLKLFNQCDDPLIRKIIEIGCVCNNASVVNGNLNGQPTEGAFIVLANKVKVMNNLSQKYIRLKEWPFSSESKMMMVKCQIKNTQDNIYFVKGAIERILTFCTHYYSSTGPQIINDMKISNIMEEASSLGNNGMRVIGLAEGWNTEQMIYCGMVGIIDPPKNKVEESVAIIRQSGVKVAMITGDALETACFIASKLGIYQPGQSQCISGDELDALSSKVTSDFLNKVTVFYRTSPRHKSIIVKAYQSRKQVVAMTGDGVNDAVALKSADIGIAMGLQGTDVCKEAAGIVLTDDNFSTIVAAMEEGKAIFHNIRNFVRFQLSTSIAALSLITFSTLFQWPNPLNPMQILWINILMDGPPAQSLGVEPADPEIIKQPPREVAESILNRRLIINVVLSALCIVIGTLWIFNREMSDNKVTPRDTTMTFTCFVLFDMFNALSCRSQKKSIFTIGFTTNKVFIVSVGLSLLGQLLVIYFPPLQLIFLTEALNISDLLLLIAIASSVFVVSEIKKYIERNHFYPILIYLRNFVRNSQKKKSISDEFV